VCDYDSDYNSRKVVITNSDRALSRLEDTDIGDHSMIVYPDIGAFRTLYSAFARKRLLANEIVVLLPFYEPPDSVRLCLSDLAGVNSAKYEDNGSLVITDAMKMHFGNNVLFTSFLGMLAKHAKQSGKSGVSLFADMGSFFYVYFRHGKLAQLVRFEKSLPTRFDTDLRGYCCYHRLNYDMLTNNQKQVLRRHHSKQFMVKPTAATNATSVSAAT